MRGETVNAVTLREMDKALRFVHGSFVAAAKLLDMEPQRFRNLVNYHPSLARWRQNRRGRPAQKVGFFIQPFSQTDTAIPSGLELVKCAWKGLTDAERLQIKEWIGAQSSPGAVLTK